MLRYQAEAQEAAAQVELYRERTLKAERRAAEGERISRAVAQGQEIEGWTALRARVAELEEAAPRVLELEQLLAAAQAERDAAQRLVVELQRSQTAEAHADELRRRDRERDDLLKKADDATEGWRQKALALQEQVQRLEQQVVDEQAKVIDWSRVTSLDPALWPPGLQELIREAEQRGETRGQGALLGAIQDAQQRATAGAPELCFGCLKNPASKKVAGVPLCVPCAIEASRTTERPAGGRRRKAHA